MKISCIIPTKNRCQTVLQAILSVCQQDDGSPIEIIVVDDGSSDGTPVQIRSTFPEVELIESPGGLGPGLARNIGAEAAQGDILMFLDSDDLWFADHARNLCRTLSRGFEVAYGTTRTIDEINGGEFLIPDQGQGPEGDCFEAMTRWCFLSPSAVAISRAAFAKVGGFALQTPGEDWDLFLRLAADYDFGFTGNRPISLRRLHQDSLCGTISHAQLLKMLNRIEQTLKSLARTRPKHLTPTTFMLNWTREREKEWTNVQRWYTQMQEEKLRTTY